MAFKTRTMQPDPHLAGYPPVVRARMELRRSPARSDRLIAQTADCAPSTVHKMRRQLEDSGEIPPAPVRRAIPQAHPSRTREAVASLGLDATPRQVAEAGGVSERMARRVLAELRAQAAPCEHCGKLYVPSPRNRGNRVQRFCSHRCAGMAYKAGQRARMHLPSSGSTAAKLELERAYRGIAPTPDLRAGYCAKAPPDKRRLWTSGHPDDREAAKHMCLAACPILNICRAWAVTLPKSDYGIYGGIDWSERMAAKYAAKGKPLAS